MTDMKDQEILIQYRLEQAYCALKDAVFLRENSDTTLGAVNRAYYAMFYTVLALLQKIEKVPRKHSGAIALFDAEFIKTGIFPRELSIFLHRAFEFRQNSDYHTMEPVSREKTDELIQNASLFVQTIDAYLKGMADGPKSKKI